MGKPTGFIEIARKKQPTRPVAERVRDWQRGLPALRRDALRGQARGAWTAAFRSVTRAVRSAI